MEKEKKVWAKPEVQSLSVKDSTLTGTVPGLPEGQQAGNSYQYGDKS